MAAVSWLNDLRETFLCFTVERKKGLMGIAFRDFFAELLVYMQIKRRNQNDMNC